MEIVQDAVKELEKTWKHQVPFNQKVIETVRIPLVAFDLSLTLDQLVRRYLYKMSRHNNKSQSCHRVWTEHDIIIDIHRDEVDKLAAEMSGSKAGSPAYLAYYKKAVKTIKDGLDEDTRVKYRAEAKKWTEHRLPPREQMR